MSDATTDATKPLRADAQRNREKLLDAAAVAFAEQGARASLEAIAKRAGVGVGTLYRHFPTREALIEATYRQEVDRLGAAVEPLLGEHEPPEALSAWLERFLGYMRTKRGMAEAMQSVVVAQKGTARGMLETALGALLAAGQADGSLRADVDVEDVLVSVSVLWTLAERPDADERARRTVRILVDGLRAR